ncbi:hypothetical protein BofuT4_uP067190.1 [Botrytis cinerea T4]|uniref:Uncharacterized protein n=1 Tax=Botryotinia fuckeliana (strain T4) TaxID=999810 RepID=G2XRE3_BOTF4|nr:hypothetical protein BofuT4_uP067190.1 [Botrytis cinerea T4]
MRYDVKFLAWHLQINTGASACIDSGGEIPFGGDI